ncbi:RNA polymerase sigma factor [Solirubrobacter sp. CPCC 204708]|uniref:RNA polymerase sigma factor n=1 Tax=Solirubrobacter deserti TaxID=2282478 RepID=A0ABT4REB7_9ACTN|nr:RNA polymerase sigma factor [Solirubrobacter deserti]MBE2316135.1 RNA polymerase sigma factor [Solirubrobacter deserti]MDA0136884.1 RNA polymerase sigma factor [Solirubrobacter deserti]
MNDRDRFAELYDRHAAELLRFCFRQCGNAADAQDLLSITFLEAWRRRGDLRPETARPWLYGIATNVAHNQRRLARRHAAALDRLKAVRPPASHDQQVRELLDDLRTLPRRELDVVALCAWAGLSYEETALALEIPVGTVRSRLNRARRRLGELRATPTRPAGALHD